MISQSIVAVIYITEDSGTYLFCTWLNDHDRVWHNINSHTQIMPLIVLKMSSKISARRQRQQIIPLKIQTDVKDEAS